jgi:hypothetical protein
VTIDNTLTMWGSMAVLVVGFMMIASPKELLGNAKSVFLFLMCVLAPLAMLYELNRAACEQASGIGRCYFD